MVSSTTQRIGPSEPQAQRSYSAVAAAAAAVVHSIEVEIGGMEAFQW